MSKIYAESASIRDLKGAVARPESEPGFLSLITVVVLYWVLRRADKVDTAHCAEMINGLLDARELRVGQDSISRAALIESGDGPD